METTETLEPTSPPELAEFVSPDQLGRLIQIAREEDLGPRGDDLTSRLTIPESQAGAAEMVARQRGLLAGTALLDAVARAYHPAIRVEHLRADGSLIGPGTAVVRYTGPLRYILSMERVALNLVCHLSGIATLTARYVARCRGNRARICDTRKTLPGLRGLQKYAVRCGGGHSHRLGLYDAVLIKDNHIAHLNSDELCDSIDSVLHSLEQEPVSPRFVQVEVDSLPQLHRILPSGVDLVLLDNMTPDRLREAVSLRDRIAPAVGLEASGGVSLQTVADIAATGVDRISVGALTHSAPALDLGLDIHTQG